MAQRIEIRDEVPHLAIRVHQVANLHRLVGLLKFGGLGGDGNERGLTGEFKAREKVPPLGINTALVLLPGGVLPLDEIDVARVDRIHGHEGRRLWRTHKNLQVHPTASDPRNAAKALFPRPAATETDRGGPPLSAVRNGVNSGRAGLNMVRNGAWDANWS